MAKRKTLQELTLKENFMFSAVMMEPENCRHLLEMALDCEIERVVVDRERSLIYNPEYRGVRLDVFARDKDNTHFNVEMQVRRKHLEKRVRYYHSQMDMEMLLSGTDYKLLPDSYVLFLCDYDPFGLGKYRYTLKKSFEEVPGYNYNDGSHTVYLSTKGTNTQEVPEQLVKFLRFLSVDLEDSEADFADEYVARLQSTIRSIKFSREMGERYMLFEELLKDEREEGRQEGRKEGQLLNLINQVCRKLQKGKAPSVIAEELEEDAALIQSICEVACSFAPEYDAERIYEAMNDTETDM